ncbi:uncharacterized protein LOC117103265 [Anneissia japonica]|uniref:uncharacterized protein LOC117103265 n=1 Tax=Anneissia japonica TaxID=1529436 RepID=UPI0014259056|nr:uncharacterized protein LOC117103265 [Anneissia japonica]
MSCILYLKFYNRCTEDYRGETCDKKKLGTWIIVGIVLGSLGGVLLIITLICCCCVVCSGRQQNAMYQQEVILKRPKYLEENVYDNTNLSPRFGHMYYDKNVTPENLGGRFKHNGHFSRPYIVTGNELENLANRDRMYYNNFSMMK